MLAVGAMNMLLMASTGRRVLATVLVTNCCDRREPRRDLEPAL
jgi:hypothetical protein